MKFLVIPDIHGRDAWKLATSRVGEFDRIIFLGDYLDAYFPTEKATELSNLEDILEFKQKHPSKVRLLLGNHEIHYMYDRAPQCTRMNYERCEDYNRLLTGNIDSFDIFYKYGNLLFVHAGFVESNLSKLRLNTSDEKHLPAIDLYDDSCGWMFEVGHSRGGVKGSTPGCFWADFDDDLKLADAPLGFIQVVGHTSGYGVRTKLRVNKGQLEGYMCMDTLGKQPNLLHSIDTGENDDEFNLNIVRHVI